jgi:LPXTG-motif cell wall-anchored protein
MKKVRLVAFFLTICLSSLCAFADDHDHDGDDQNKNSGKTDATEMSILGLAAATFIGAGSYLAHRRRNRSRG